MTTFVIVTMSLDEIKEKYSGGNDQSREAFDELCGLVENLYVSWLIELVNIQLTRCIIIIIVSKSIRWMLILLYIFKAEREERKEAATARLNHLKEVIAKLKEKNQTMRGKYIVLLDQ